MNQRVAKALRRKAKEDFKIGAIKNVGSRYNQLKKEYKKIKQGRALVS